MLYWYFCIINFIIIAHFYKEFNIFITKITSISDNPPRTSLPSSLPTLNHILLFFSSPQSLPPSNLHFLNLLHLHFFTFRFLHYFLSFHLFHFTFIFLTIPSPVSLAWLFSCLVCFIFDLLRLECCWVRVFIAVDFVHVLLDVVDWRLRLWQVEELLYVLELVLICLGVELARMGGL